MLRVCSAALPTQVDAGLQALQAVIDALPSYHERVVAAGRYFANENRAGNTTFDAVKATLSGMCVGARRCMYCEDSAADEVEHFRPKSFYPDGTFVWLNYLFTCGGCNRCKGSAFRLLTTNMQVVDLRRGRLEPYVEPLPGKPVMLNPREENPLDFLQLDLRGTFHFLPRHPVGTHEHDRAAYTIAALRLNRRDYLVEARREAYATYRSRLLEYVDSKETPRAARLASSLRSCQHPTVWAEMKSQRDVLPDVEPLFTKAPESLTW